MARQVGTLLIHGSVGNVRNYRLTGLKGLVASLKGGPTKSQIDTLPQFEGCRNRNSEWKGLQLLVHEAITGFYVYPRHLFDSKMASRLVSEYYKLLAFDTTNPPGKRALDLSFNLVAPWPLILSIDHPITKVSCVNFEFEHSLVTGDVTLYFQGAKWSNVFYFKGKETHVRVTNFCTQLADVEYNAINMRYEKVAGGMMEGGRFTSSAWLSKEDTAETTINVVQTFPDFGSLGAGNSIYQICVIEFAQLINGVYYPTAHYGIKVVDAFTFG